MKRALVVALLLACAAPRGAQAQRFDAVLTEAGHARVVGVLKMDDRRMLHVVSSQPGQGKFLEKLADEVNAESTLHLDAPPPAGSPQFADVTAPVDRSDPRFPAALREHLQKYYDVTLK